MMAWFYVITEEMRQWGLSGNELLVFALVNTFSQQAQGCYWGSLEYTCECCGISNATAKRTLKSLIEKGFIIRNKVVVGDNIRSIYIATRVSKCTPMAQNEPREGIKMNPNNKDININNNTLSNKETGRFKKPSIEEIRSYCLEKSSRVDPEQFFNFYESNGWMVGKNHMKDWRAAVRTWEKREKEVPQRKRETPHKESVLEHNLKVMDELFGTDLHKRAYGNNQGGDIDEQ